MNYGRHRSEMAANSLTPVHHSTTPPFLDLELGQAYIAETLYETRTNATTGQNEYLVKWQNYPLSDASYEPYCNQNTEI